MRCRATVTTSSRMEHDARADGDAAETVQWRAGWYSGSMEERERIGFATIRLERVAADSAWAHADSDHDDPATSLFLIRVMTCADVGGDVPATSFTFDSAEGAVEAIGAFVDEWIHNAAGY